MDGTLVVGYYVYVSSRCWLRVVLDRIAFYVRRYCVGVSTNVQTFCDHSWGNITVATQELMYVHSGLQRRMYAIEEKLKGELFDREIQIEVLKKNIKNLKKKRKARTKHPHTMGSIDASSDIKHII
jgi:hypothetical protein